LPECRRGASTRLLCCLSHRDANRRDIPSESGEDHELCAPSPIAPGLIRAMCQIVQILLAGPGRSFTTSLHQEPVKSEKRGFVQHSSPTTTLSPQMDFQPRC